MNEAGMARGAVVIKLGGSLSTTAFLPEVLKALADAAARGRRIVIVPGGGAFADQVRAMQQTWGFDEAAAHDMALLAMAQYGRLLAALAPLEVCWGAPAVAAALAKPGGRPLVWLPQPQRDGLRLERSWRISADSLALWLAGQVGAEQVWLVKSCASPGDVSLAELAAAGIVDAAYAEMATSLPEVATNLIYAVNGADLTEALATFR